MISLVTRPTRGKTGRVVLAQTCRTSDILHYIQSLGYSPSGPTDISPRDAVSTPEILVAIGSTVAHPERKHSHVPAYVGYDKNGNKVHVMASEGSLNPNIEVAIKVA